MELENNRNIIIKKADKRENKVLMSTKHYSKMVYDHINDNQSPSCQHVVHEVHVTCSTCQVYVTCQVHVTCSTCDNKVMKKIKKLSQKYKNILNKLKIDYLIIFQLQQAISMVSRTFANLL